MTGSFIEACFDHVITELRRCRAFDDLGVRLVALTLFDDLLEAVFGGVVAAAIDMHPAVRADPFRAHLDVFMSTGDGHGDVARVFRFGAVLGGGVPDVSARRHVHLDGLDLSRTAAVHVHAPVGDVAVVADPVEQLTAADVVIPAPVLVNAALDVILHRGRSDPHLIIKIGRRRGDAALVTRFGKVMVTGRKTDLDMREFADQAIAHDLGSDAEIVFTALPGAGLPDALILLHGSHDGLLLGNGSGERLFTVDVLAVFRGFDGGERVPVVRDGDHDSVDVLARHDLAVVVIAFAVLVLVGAVDGVERLLQIAFVDVTGRHDLAVGFIEKFGRVTRAHHTPAEHGHGDLVGRCVLTKHTCGHNGRETNGGGGLRDELAAG